jgi:low affinity Fe/Cu permease
VHAHRTHDNGFRQACAPKLSYHPPSLGGASSIDARLTSEAWTFGLREVEARVQHGDMHTDVSVPQSDTASRPPIRDRFNRIADSLTAALGSFTALAASVVLVVVWALTGPIFNFSDTWQLFINTTTTVVTFWMVFVIQNSANRSAKATQLKLDEIIRSLESARNDFIALDKATESVLDKHEQEFDELVKGEISDVSIGK